MREIKIFDSNEELNIFAATEIIAIAAESIRRRGFFSMALAGGSTPKSLYQLLSEREFAEKINWNAAAFFFGDERNVAPDSDESNFKMANDNLFKPLNISPDRVYRWRTELGQPDKIADDYAAAVELFFQGFPKFDLILLGMGDDGHTASLFPFTNALEESGKIAVANRVEKLNATRLTLTFPVLNSARNAMFLVSGEKKAETLREVLQGDFQPRRLPSQNVKPADGRLFWLADSAAARLLKI